MLLWIIILLILFCLLGLGYFLRWIEQTFFTAGQDNEESLSILKKRYAQGEISREEYLRMKKDLLLRKKKRA